MAPYHLSSKTLLSLDQPLRWSHGECWCWKYRQSGWKKGVEERDVIEMGEVGTDVRDKDKVWWERSVIEGKVRLELSVA